MYVTEVLRQRTKETEQSKDRVKNKTEERMNFRKSGRDLDNEA